MVYLIITHVKETEIMQCVEDIQSAKIAIMDDEFETQD